MTSRLQEPDEPGADADRVQAEGVPDGEEQEGLLEQARPRHQGRTHHGRRQALDRQGGRELFQLVTTVDKINSGSKSCIREKRTSQ